MKRVGICTVAQPFAPLVDSEYVQSLSEESAADLALPPGTTRADFFAGSYRIRADVPTADRRLLDILRDGTRHYLEVHHVSVGSSDGAEAATGLLRKAEIDMVAVRAEPSRAEGRLYGYVKKTAVRVMLVLGAHRIEGNVFVENAASDPMAYFLRGVEKSTERFVAVGSATITSADGSNDAAGLVILNQNAVSLFSVLR
jgi:hypothetical protein